MFQSTSEDGILTLTTNGRLDADTSGAFSDALNQFIDNGNHKIILDLAGVDYVSSVGLRALMLGAKRVAPHGGKIVICAPHARVRKLLELAGFTSILPIAGTRDEALERLR
jgi:stage II sporulation protein AA (anti-sigma F factor antagonist)